MKHAPPEIVEPAPALRLSRLAVGCAARVLKLDTADAGKARKLLALGVLPGSRVTVLRRSPALLFRLGHALFAVDESLASAVVVTIETTH